MHMYKMYRLIVPYAPNAFSRRVDYSLLACFGKASCSKNSSVKALRCQLPRENAFYPYEPDDKAQAVVATVDAETAQVSNNSNIPIPVSVVYSFHEEDGRMLRCTTTSIGHQIDRLLQVAEILRCWGRDRFGVVGR